MYKNCLTVRHKKCTHFSVWKTPKCMLMRHEQMFALIQCLKTMHPPSLAPPNPPFDCPTSIKCLKQHITPSSYHAHAKKLTTLKHVKTFKPPPPQLIFYIPKLFLKENSLFKTIIKNVWQWGMEKIHGHSVSEKKSNLCQWGMKKKGSSMWKNQLPSSM